MYYLTDSIPLIAPSTNSTKQPPYTRESLGIRDAGRDYIALNGKFKEVSVAGMIVKLQQCTQ